jgi:hypothetical protein
MLSSGLRKAMKALKDFAAAIDAVRTQQAWFMDGARIG